ncbi:MAG: DUF1772 domain-containing protein [Proteobacteria bacterium]|nr:MAG: DUF1772 domain-containing protein [Pseudomonadota bacterium]
MEENTPFSIKYWAEDDKPREKLMLKGKDALSDAELIAILIGSGSRNESAVGLSQRILASVENLNALGKLSLQQLTTFKGIGEAKAITIIAAMELGRRRRSEETVELTKITSSRIAFIVSSALFLAALLFSFVGPVPINNRIAAWNLNALPANWKSECTRWNTLHAIRTVMLLL